MDFIKAFIKLRSNSKKNVIEGINIMKQLMLIDEYNKDEYDYNIAYGYYRIGFFDKFDKIYQNSLFQKNIYRLNIIRYNIDNELLHKKNSDTDNMFSPLAYTLLSLSGGLILFYFS